MCGELCDFTAESLAGNEVEAREGRAGVEREELDGEGGGEGHGYFLLEGDAAVVEIDGGGVGGLAARQQERAEREVEQGLVLVQQHEQKIA